MFSKQLLSVSCSEKSKRRTRTEQKTNEPNWNQMFIYCPVKPEDFAERMIEITVWDYDRIGASEFLGEVSSEFLGEVSSELIWEVNS